MKSKDSNYDLNKRLKCDDKLINVNKSMIMGVLNLTPDSFFEGSRNRSVEDAFLRAESMIESGVDIIDVGGVSTREGADLLSTEEELNRIIPIIKLLKNKFSEILISVDTFRSEVARIAVENGADIINDVYGGEYDDKMFDLVAELDVAYILMHARGDAQTMQSLCQYDDVVKEVVFELSQKVEKLRQKGVKDIIVDPGFGFAKNLEQNYTLFKNVAYLKLLDCPILIGISRKSMIYKLLDIKADNSLNGTTVLNTLSIFENYAIIRVHDVEEAVQARQIIEAINA